MAKHEGLVRLGDRKGHAGVGDRIRHAGVGNGVWRLLGFGAGIGLSRLVGIIRHVDGTSDRPDAGEFAGPTEENVAERMHQNLPSSQVRIALPWANVIGEIAERHPGCAHAAL